MIEFPVPVDASVTEAPWIGLLNPSSTVTVTVVADEPEEAVSVDESALTTEFPALTLPTFAVAVKFAGLPETDPGTVA